MSVGIYWMPVQPREGHRVAGTSSTVEQIRHVFGECPVDLDQRALCTLHAMAAVDSHGPWKELEDALSRHDAIHVYAES